MTSLLKLIITCLLLGQAGQPARANSAGVALSSESAARTAEPGDRELAGPRRGGANGGASLGGVVTLAEGLWPLGVVLVLILGGAVILRNVFAGRRRQDAGEMIKVISRHYLSPKQSICLVRVGGRVLTLGVTTERITTLAQIDDPVSAAKLVGAAESGRSGSLSGRFQSFLTGASNEFGEAPGREAMTSVARLRESVRGAGRSIARG